MSNSSSFTCAVNCDNHLATKCTMGQTNSVMLLS